jgi:glycosyltransferase involved in cell wall biosynthesis
VATSEIEGFGHTLNEALACGPILVTTNAPPMNEIATAESAVLVDFESTEPMASGTRYKFASDSFTCAIERVLGMSDVERQRLSAAARETYDRGHRKFVTQLRELLEAI